MLSSITPLGQRGRGGSWLRTVIAFWVGAVAAGVVIFGSLGLVGSALDVGSLNPWYSLTILITAALLDWRGVRPPGLHRQVDEDWLGRYRDWVVGLGFGAQLGSGFATIIPSFGTWALYLIALGAGVPAAVAIGFGFGVGRSLLLLSTRRVRSPSVLAATMRAFSGAEGRVRWASIAGYAAVIVVGVYVA
jgi:hypothetical protein